IYDDMGGAGWTNTTNWPAPGNWPASATSAEFGSWHGIGVQNGDIREIGLPGNNITGEIPEDIMQLTELWALNFSDNHITSFPPSLLSHAKLSRLSLSSNDIT